MQLVKKHDTARIIQCMLRFGAQDTRIAVYETLKGIHTKYLQLKALSYINSLFILFIVVSLEHTVELSKLKYAKFVVKSLFKYW